MKFKRDYGSDQPSTYKFKMYSIYIILYILLILFSGKRRQISYEGKLTYSIACTGLKMLKIEEKIFIICALFVNEEDIIF